VVTGQQVEGYFQGEMDICPRCTHTVSVIVSCEYQY
jgi:hypothetical protein